jgi:hypothetical protein
VNQTQAPISSQPQIRVTGQRKSVKISGAVEVYTAQLTYHSANVFNATTYLDFLEQLARRCYPRRTHLIQENVSCHNDATVLFGSKTIGAGWKSIHSRHIHQN